MQDRREESRLDISKEDIRGNRFTILALPNWGLFLALLITEFKKYQTWDYFNRKGKENQKVS